MTGKGNGFWRQIHDAGQDERRRKGKEAGGFETRPYWCIMTEKIAGCNTSGWLGKDGH
jgi:hypothetical protein